jgi:NADPH:quinone reductase-like Zn-dependent oxidoreductase
MTHKVWIVDEPNAAFREMEVPRPIPKAKQVLVRISASGVNPLDTKIRAGAAAHAQQALPAVLCVDMAGTV